MSSYLETIHTKLRPQPVNTPVVLDLFAGCGGMALGFEAQGFATVGFEKNPEACATW
ncbi:MAG: DNA cytosine methyltransferase [Chloroflexi bacterium]|nr:DNA cytosine methyltransferase [Chloroflexota bacterium]MBP8056392.1 DNA cytosine methyltransferase [Chloroflexota bacterium]